MKVHIHKKSNGEYLTSYDLEGDETITGVKNKFVESHLYYPERQAWYGANAKKRCADEQTLDELLTIQEGHESSPTTGKDAVALVLMFKDLGIQISWRVVFLVEYAGPLIIFPWFYLQLAKPNLTQKTAFAMVMLHYLKREAESLFVHRFSNATMPIVRVPLNCGHYWILCGVFIGYYLFHEKYSAPWGDNISIHVICFVVWAIAEVLNGLCHLHLRSLRSRGSKERKIPHGYGFDIVSCANYWWESVAWLSFSILTNTLTGWFFMIVAFLQMAEWAVKKHRNYKKEFAGYPRNRRAIVPLLL